MNLRKFFYLLPILAAFMLTGCGDDDDPEPLPDLPFDKHDRNNLSMSGVTNMEYTLGEEPGKYKFAYDETIYTFRFIGTAVDCTIYQVKFSEKMPVIAAIGLPTMILTQDESGNDMVSATNVFGLIPNGEEGAGTPSTGIKYNSFEAKFFGENRATCSINYTVSVNMKVSDRTFEIDGKAIFIGRSMSM